MGSGKSHFAVHWIGITLVLSGKRFATTRMCAMTRWMTANQEVCWAYKEVKEYAGVRRIMQ